MMLVGDSQLAPDKGLECEALNLLLFSVGGVFFGVDADQVAEISAYRNGTDKDLFWFHEEMDYKKKTVEYRLPTIITIRTEVDPYRVVIDSMEDIAEFNPKEISLLPTLLEPFALQRGIWGVLLRNDRMILLLDFLRLPRGKRAQEYRSGVGMKRPDCAVVISVDAI